MSTRENDESWRGKIGKMSTDEVDGFLNEPFLARVACLDDNEWPYVVPCWYQWDGAALWVVPRALRLGALSRSEAPLRGHDRRILGCRPRLRYRRAAALPRPVRGRDRRAAERRRPLGGGRSHHVGSLLRRERPELPGAHHELETLADPPRPCSHTDVAGHRLARALSGRRRRRPLSGPARRPALPVVGGETGLTRYLTTVPRAVQLIISFSILQYLSKFVSGSFDIASDAELHLLHIRTLQRMDNILVPHVTIGKVVSSLE